MKRFTKPRLRRLLLLGAAGLAVACTPAGPGAATTPANPSAAPAGGSVAPPSTAPSPSAAGKYGY